MSAFRKLVVTMIIIASVSIGIGGMLLSRAGASGSTVWAEFRSFFGDSGIGVDFGNHVDVDVSETASLSGVKEIFVDTIIGDIYILEKDEGELAVRVKGTLEERHKDDLLTIERQGEILTIEVLKLRNLASFRTFTSRTQIDITLEIPKGYENDLLLKSISGSILVNGLRLDGVEATTVSGDIVMENGFVEDLSIRSTSGSLYVYSEAKTLEGSNVSGSLLASRVGEVIDYESVSGSITVVLQDAKEESTLKSVSGSIRVDVLLPDRIAYTLESVSGRLEVEGAGETLTADRRLSRSDTSAPAALKAATVSGSIRVKY